MSETALNWTAIAFLLSWIFLGGLTALFDDLVIFGSRHRRTWRVISNITGPFSTLCFFATVAFFILFLIVAAAERL
jgi:hypothetical protein